MAHHRPATRLLCALVGVFSISPVAASVVDSGAVETVEAVAALVVGTAMCLAGYRLLLATALACSFLLGGVISAYALAAVVLPVISLAVGGLALAGLSLLSRRVGACSVGGCAGCALAYVVYVLAGDKLSPGDPERALVGLCAACGVVAAAGVWRFQAPALIAASSVAGAALALLALAHFIKHFPDAEGLAAFRAQAAEGSQQWLAAVPRAWWSYLLMLVAYSAIGAHVQFQTRAKAGGEGNARADHPLRLRSRAQAAESSHYVRLDAAA